MTRKLSTREGLAWLLTFVFGAFSIVPIWYGGCVGGALFLALGAGSFFVFQVLILKPGKEMPTQ